MTAIRTREEEILTDLIEKLRNLKRAQKQPRGKHSQFIMRGLEIAESLLVRELARWRTGCAACGGSGLEENGEDACLACGGTGRRRPAGEEK